MKLRMLFVLLGILGLGGGARLEAQVVVIVSAKASFFKVPPPLVSQIFMGQATTFHTGTQAVPIDQPEASAARKEFYQHYLGKDLAQVKAIWSRLVFSGKAALPQVLPSGKEVVDLVAQNPKYIGYVNNSEVNSSVKIVLED